MERIDCPINAVRYLLPSRLQLGDASPGNRELMLQHSYPLLQRDTVTCRLTGCASGRTTGAMASRYLGAALAFAAARGVPGNNIP